MSYVDKIIGRFGGVRRLAALAALPPSTVQSWKRAGVIPARRQRDLLEAAGSHGIDLAPADFFDAPTPARNRAAIKLLQAWIDDFGDREDPDLAAQMKELRKGRMRLRRGRSAC